MRLNNGAAISVACCTRIHACIFFFLLPDLKMHSGSLLLTYVHLMIMLTSLPSSEGGEETTEHDDYGTTESANGTGRLWIWIGVGITLIILVTLAVVTIIILIWRRREKLAQQAANKPTEKSILISDIVDTLVVVDSDPGIAGAVINPAAPLSESAAKAPPSPPAKTAQ